MKTEFNGSEKQEPLMMKRWSLPDVQEDLLYIKAALTLMDPNKLRGNHPQTSGSNKLFVASRCLGFLLLVSVFLFSEPLPRVKQREALTEQKRWDLVSERVSPSGWMGVNPSRFHLIGRSKR